MSDQTTASSDLSPLIYLLISITPGSRKRSRRKRSQKKGKIGPKREKWDQKGKKGPKNRTFCSLFPFFWDHLRTWYAKDPTFFGSFWDLLRDPGVGGREIGRSGTTLIFYIS